MTHKKEFLHKYPHLKFQVDVDDEGRAGLQDAIPRAEPEIQPEQLVLRGHREGGVVDVQALTPVISDGALVGVVLGLRHQEHVRSLVANAEQDEESPQKQHRQDDFFFVIVFSS